MKKLATWLKGHKEVVALVGLPLLLTAIGMAIYVLPTAFTHPQYDFVYAKCDNYCSYNGWDVSRGKITINNNYTSYNRDVYGQDFDFYRYDVDLHQSTLLSESDLDDITIGENSEAPDGFVVERGSYSSAGWFFGGGYSSGSYNTFYAINGAAKRELNLKSSSYGDIEFIGWIIND